MWIWMTLALLMASSSVWADLCRVHSLPDGSVTVTCPAETPPHKAGLPFIDVPRETIQAMDRTKRHAWREKHGKIEVDPTVPDRPRSKEQQRKTVCSKIEQDANAILGLKELCATF